MLELSRRAVLSTGGRAAVATLSLGGLAVAATEDDPIFPVLDAYRKAARLALDLYSELDEAKGKAATLTGERRPSPLIMWGNYTISGGEIDLRRNELLQDWAKGDPNSTALVEAAYVDAKGQEQAAIADGIEWDARNGLTELHSRFERAEDERSAAVGQLIMTVPTTVAGCAALVGAVADEFDGGEMVWFEPALVNAAQALTRLTGGQANV